MKRLVILILLLLAGPAWATHYYVDNCVVTGNNANNGTDPSTPWLTLAKVSASSFSAGDIISLEKTCTWVEALSWGASSGSAGNPITINSYGSGAQPIFDCSAIATSCVRTNEASYLTFDGIHPKNGTDLNHAIFQLGSNSVVGIVIQNSTIEGGVGSGILVQGTVTCNSNVLHNNIIQNVGAWGIAISKQCTSGEISNNTITGNGLDSVADNQEYSGIDGSLGNWNVFVNTVTNAAPNGCKTSGSLGTFCHEIYYSSGFGGDLTQVANIYGNSASGSGFGLGIKLTGSANVYRNLVFNNYAGGINTGQNSTANVIYQVYNNILYNNLTGNVAGAGGITEVNQGAGTISLTINGNTLYQNGNTAGEEVLINNNIQSYTMKNNIFYSNSTRPTFETGVASLTGTISIDYNDYFESTGNSAIFVNSSLVTWATWQGLGYDAHGLNGIDPLLTNVSSNDVTLTSSSPAKNTGATLSSTFQLGLDPRTTFPYGVQNQNNGSAWDMGAFAFVPGALATGIGANAGIGANVGVH